MKIATLTYQRHDNIGAMLQCYALQNAIIKKGAENEIIDYICDAADRAFCLKSFKTKGVKKYITSIIGVISRLPKKRAFVKFRKDKLILTKKFTEKNIAQIADLYDGYIVGSDNVWNSKLTGLDLNYFFDFVTNDDKKASYAASMGLSGIPEGEKKAFKEHLEKFAIVSTREKIIADDLNSFADVNAFDTCDPTFFLTAEEWDELAIQPKNKGKYVLVYQMSPSASFVKFAREFAKAKGLPMVYVPFPYGFCKCSMKPHIGPQEWLGYMKNAEYVLTDSFHGCVFASIYERNLIIKISQLGARMHNLTEKLGTQERIVETVEEAVNLPDMDYTQIRKNVEEYKNQGLENLDKILNHFDSKKKTE